ncbi:hypothetical protein N7488_011185 [Penicillium malachiteum]|nr:hypothetical protein N7488_011185 [Penicillium malachiteum]
MPLGDWCRFILNAPFQFSIALKGKSFKGNLLGKLLQIQGRNELVIRHGQRNDWDAAKFFSMINSPLANVEAVVMHASIAPSTRARSNFYVVVEGIKECANCHWGKMDRRCSFNTGAPEPKFHLKSKKLYTNEELQALALLQSDFGVSPSHFTLISSFVEFVLCIAT